MSGVKHVFLLPSGGRQRNYHLVGGADEESFRSQPCGLPCSTSTPKPHAQKVGNSVGRTVAGTWGPAHLYQGSQSGNPNRSDPRLSKLPANCFGSRQETFSRWCWETPSPCWPMLSVPFTTFWDQRSSFCMCALPMRLVRWLDAPSLPVKIRQCSQRGLTSNRAEDSS